MHAGAQISAAASAAEASVGPLLASLQVLMLHSCDSSISAGQLLPQPLGLAAILSGCLLMALVLIDAHGTYLRMRRLHR